MFLQLRPWFDRTSHKITALIAWSCVLLLCLLVVGLIYKSIPVIKDHGFSELLFSSDWKPLKSSFGFRPFIMSTVYVTFTALIIAVPVCILASLYLVEFAPQRFTKNILPLIDVLAGIPSVVFGIWGVIMIVPFVRDYLAPLMYKESIGFSILSGGIVLAVMIFPLMINLLIEVFRAVPRELREASLSLGATRWETSFYIVLRKAIPGIFASVILAFSRAFGETIAVLMVIGNVVKTPESVFDPGYPLPSLIANNFGEMMSIPSYDSALMFAALILLMIMIVFNFVSSYILKKLNIYIS